MRAENSFGAWLERLTDLQDRRSFRNFNKIAIDDLGTGYSSLGSLKHLPIHRLKIDRLFVRDMLRDPEDIILPGGIIGLAHALGYTVVA